MNHLWAPQLACVLVVDRYVVPRHGRPATPSASKKGNLQQDLLLQVVIKDFYRLFLRIKCLLIRKGGNEGGNFEQLA